MSGVNKVILLGNLGKDPDIKYTQSGTAVTNFSLATSESWKDKNTGERVTKTEWHKVAAFGKLAETIGEYASKGKQVYVEGKLQTRSWEQNGVTRYSTEIVIDQKGVFQLLGQRGDNGNGNASNGYHGSDNGRDGNHNGGYGGGSHNSDYEDDIPF